MLLVTIIIDQFSLFLCAAPATSTVIHIILIHSFKVSLLRPIMDARLAASGRSSRNG